MCHQITVVDFQSHCPWRRWPFQLVLIVDCLCARWCLFGDLPRWHNTAFLRYEVADLLYKMLLVTSSEGNILKLTKIFHTKSYLTLFLRYKVTLFLDLFSVRRTNFQCNSSKGLTVLFPKYRKTVSTNFNVYDVNINTILLKTGITLSYRSFSFDFWL